MHIEVSAADRDTITINVSEERYYPAQLRGRLIGLIDDWNAANPWAKAILVTSSDPTLLAVAADNRYSQESVDFATVVDHTLQSAIELFGRARVLAAGSGTHGNPLRDAG